MWLKRLAVLGVSSSTLLAATIPLKRELNADVTDHQKKALPKNKSPTSYDEANRRAQRAVKRYREEFGVPGLIVGVNIDGSKYQWRSAVGYADVENLTPVTPLTVQRIASISKPMTAALIMRHVAAGNLNLNQPISAYLPDFKKPAFDGQPQDITTHQLLSHTSGIRHYDTKQDIEDKKSKNNSETNVSDEKKHQEVYNRTDFETTEASLKLFQNDELLAKPGSSFVYTTHGFTVLAAIAEKVDSANRPFAGQISALFAELGMNNTGIDLNQPIVANRARYYARNKSGQLENVEQVNCSYKWAGGGILSSVHDLLLFADHLLLSAQSSDFLNRDTVKRMWTPAIEHQVKKKYLGSSTRYYGYGWQITPGGVNTKESVIENIGDRWTHRAFVSHGGNAVGCSSMLLIRPGASTTRDPQQPRGITVAILANLEGLNMQKLALELVDIFAESDDS